MTIYDSKTILRIAREKSEYYKELFKDVPLDAPLEDYPLVDSSDFWAKAQFEEGSKILTDKFVEGRVFKSGGTTGTPKFSPYTNEEWLTMCQLLSDQNGFNFLNCGDRVCNLFYSGNMYASYDYCTIMHMLSPVKYILYNLGGHAEIPDVIYNIKQNNINVLIGLPSVIMKVIDYIENNKIKDLPIKKLCFAGESLQLNQRNYINKVFGREIEYFSFGLAGNDYGMVAYFSSDCGFNEHHVDDRACYMQIRDQETGELITEEHRVGKIYITSRHKLLMPIINYPIGDLGQWTEPEGRANRRFQLMGRNQEVARVGIVNLFKSDFDNVIAKNSWSIKNYQLIIHYNETTHKDYLLIKVATKENIAKEFLAAIYEECPMLLDTEQKHMIDKTIVEIVDSKDLIYNSRTGKLSQVLDLRFSDK